MTKRRKAKYTAHQANIVAADLNKGTSAVPWPLVVDMLKDYANLLRREEEAVLQEL